MNHYFTTDENHVANRKMVSFYFNSVNESFISDDGVFSKDTLDFGSRVMLETLLERKIEGSVLDLGCGLGYIGVLLKKYFPQIKLTMVDVNETAVGLAKDNSIKYHQNNNAVVSDGFENVTEMFDVIVTNPPIRTGKKVIYRLFEDSYNHLNENGSLYIVIRAQQGAESAVKFLKQINPDVQILKKEKGYWIILLSKILTY